MEVWKDIPNFEGMYQVSNYGNIKSLARYISNGKGKRYIDEKILTPIDNGYGYKCIGLRNKQKKTVKYIHRLVAEMFIPNPKGYKQINHKDENKSNNKATNLEWCDSQYNIDYSRSRDVIQIDMNTKEIVGIYKSCKDASRVTGFSSGNISQACNHLWKYYKGFFWKWRDEVMI